VKGGFDQQIPLPPRSTTEAIACGEASTPRVTAAAGVHRRAPRRTGRLGQHVPRYSNEMKGKAMLAKGLVTHFRKAMASPCNCFRWRVHFLPSLFCSSARQLSKFRRCFGDRGFVFSTTYEWRLNCHLSDASCDCDEEPDAEDHERGKRRSGPKG